MATNDKYTKIINQVFNGDLGKESRLLRKQREIEVFELSGVTPNEAQQAYIDSIKAEIALYDDKISLLLGETKLEDMK